MLFHPLPPPTPPSPPPPPPQHLKPFFQLILFRDMKGAGLITLLVALAMVHFMAEPASAVTCADVNKALAPCLSYLTGRAALSSGCCAGVRSLKSMAPTTGDRQTACQCAKNAASRNPNLREDAAAALPSQCGVQTNIPISRSTDCSSIS